MVSMNRLSTEKRAQIIGCLVEGNSIRATVRMTGVAKNTITSCWSTSGAVCSSTRTARCATCPASASRPTRFGRFCYAKQKNVPEDKRDESATATCGRGSRIDADTKLVPSLARRRARRRRRPRAFMHDLRKRLARTASN